MYRASPKKKPKKPKSFSLAEKNITNLISMSTICQENTLDLTEAEDIKKRWQEYTEELYKKELQDPENHDGVITHLAPDILECKVGLRKHHYEQSQWR